MKVSVVIPNLNGIKFLNKCLNSLKSQDEYIKEIILVDNGSTDGSQDYIKNFQKNYSKIRIIENKANLGFSKAVNQGIKNSSSEFIFLLNNDVEIAKNSIKNLLNCINRNENIFSVSARMIQYYNRDLIDDAGDNYTILGWTVKRGDNKPVNDFKESKKIFSSCGGAALYKKSIFDEIGLFDENFFAYMEDVDIGYRARIFGYENRYCSDAIVFHIGSATTGSKYNEFKIKLAARNNVFVPYKNMPFPQLIVNFIFLFLGFLIKLMFFTKKGYGKVYLDGVIEGLKNLKNIKRIKYNNSNIKNYFSIELRLFLNIFSYFDKK